MSKSLMQLAMSWAEKERNLDRAVQTRDTGHGGVVYSSAPNTPALKGAATRALRKLTSHAKVNGVSESEVLDAMNKAVTQAGSYREEDNHE